MKVSILAVVLALATLLLTACTTDTNPVITPVLAPPTPTSPADVTAAPSAVATATRSLPIDVTPTSIVRQPLPSLTPQVTGGAGLLVQYRKQGGLAGSSTTLTISQDGATSLKSKLSGSKVGKLTAGRLTTIEQQLDAVRNLSNLQAQYEQRTVPDDFYQTLTFPTGNAGSATRSVTVAQLGNNGTVPAPLATLIVTLDALAQGS